MLFHSHLQVLLSLHHHFRIELKMFLLINLLYIFWILLVVLLTIIQLGLVLVLVLNFLVCVILWMSSLLLMFYHLFPFHQYFLLPILGLHWIIHYILVFLRILLILISLQNDPLILVPALLLMFHFLSLFLYIYLRMLRFYQYSLQHHFGLLLLLNIRNITIGLLLLHFQLV